MYVSNMLLNIYEAFQHTTLQTPVIELQPDEQGDFRCTKSGMSLDPSVHSVIWIKSLGERAPTPSCTVIGRTLVPSTGVSSSGAQPSNGWRRTGLEGTYTYIPILLDQLKYSAHHKRHPRTGEKLSLKELVVFSPGGKWSQSKEVSLNKALKQLNRISNQEITADSSVMKMIERGELRSTRFTDCTLRDISSMSHLLDYSTWERCAFTRVRLNSSLAGLRFSHCHFEECNFESVNLSGSTFSHCTFSNVRLKDVNAQNTHFLRCKFISSPFEMLRGEFEMMQSVQTSSQEGPFENIQDGFFTLNTDKDEEIKFLSESSIRA